MRKYTNFILNSEIFIVKYKINIRLESSISEYKNLFNFELKSPIFWNIGIFFAADFFFFFFFEVVLERALGSCILLLLLLLLLLNALISLGICSTAKESK